MKSLFSSVFLFFLLKKKSGYPPILNPITAFLQFDFHALNNVYCRSKEVRACGFRSERKVELLAFKEFLQGRGWEMRTGSV